MDDKQRDGRLGVRPLEGVGPRSHRRRKEGVEYGLRVIPGSGGMLELVEEPARGWFAEYARVMQLTRWTL